MAKVFNLIRRCQRTWWRSEFINKYEYLAMKEAALTLLKEISEAY